MLNLLTIPNLLLCKQKQKESASHAPYSTSIFSFSVSVYGEGRLSPL